MAPVHNDYHQLGMSTAAVSCVCVLCNFMRMCICVLCVLCVCVCVYVCVCVCVWEREREREREINHSTLCSLNSYLLSSSSILTHAHAQRKQFICGPASFKSECGTIACISTENSRGWHYIVVCTSTCNWGQDIYWAIRFLCLTPWLHWKFTLNPWLFSTN